MNGFHVVLTDQNAVFDTYDELRVFLPVHIKYQDQAFPCSDWEDFAVPVIYQWAEELCRTQAHSTLYFMDGPYRLEIQNQGNRLRVCGVNYNHIDRVLFEAECTKTELLSELCDACKKLKSIIWDHRTAFRESACRELMEQAQYYIYKTISMLETEYRNVTTRTASDEV